MRIPLFIQIALGVVVAGLILRALETGIFSYLLAPLANVVTDQGLRPVSESTESSPLPSLSKPATSIRSASDARYQGSWHNAVKRCQVNTKTKDQQCELK